MTHIDIHQFTIEQLEQLIEESKTVLAVRIRERKTHAMAQARSILEEAGVSPRELARTKADRRPAIQLTQGCTYSNPERPAEVWTAGKGRRPKWVAALEARGMQPIEVQ
jgi:DNA-binding protein H-NS